MSKGRVTRRDLIARLGLGAAAIPLLYAGARAQSAPAFPRRLVLFTVPSCGPRDLFWPTGTETDFTLSAMTSPLEDLKKKLTFVGGVGSLSAYDQPNFAVHEAHCHLLTGAQTVSLQGANGRYNGVGGPSLDWTLANLPAMSGLPFPQLVVGYNYEGNGYTRAAPKAAGQAAPEITRRDNPATLFDQLFAGRPTVGTAVDPSIARIREERASVLDYLTSSLNSYKVNLGTEDRQKIDFHLDGLRDLERNLNGNATTLGCTPGTRPMTADFSNIDNVPALVQRQLDVVTAALSCDLTRVVTLQWAHDGGNRWNYPWLGPEFKQAVPKASDPAGTGIISQHYLQHQAWTSPDLTAMRAKLEGWWLSQYAYLAHKLNSVQEGSGTMLDNTALVFIGAQGFPGNHELYPHPIIITGSCGGFFRTGRFVKFGSRTDYNEPEVTKVATRDGLVAHNRLLVSLANAMGHPISTFGMTGSAYQGPLTELHA